MYRLYGVLAFAAIFFFCMGISTMEQAEMSRHPKYVTLAQLASDKPKSGYYTIHGGVLDLYGAAKKSTGSGDDAGVRYLVPLIEPADNPATATSQVLVATNDPSLINTIEHGFNLPQNTTGRRSKDNASAMLVPRDVTGRITPGKFDALSLFSQGRRVDAGTIEIDEGISPPSMLAGEKMTVFGTVIAAIMACALVFTWRANRQNRNWWVPTRFPSTTIAPPSNGSTDNPAPYYSTPPTEVAASTVTQNSSGTPWWEQPNAGSPQNKE